MSLLSRFDHSPQVGRAADMRGRVGVRQSHQARPHALADFMEDVGILLRYATGRDYYDRRLPLPKD